MKFQPQQHQSKPDQPQGLALSEDGLSELSSVCAGFQADLSCLVDQELDERASARAITHLESCGECRGFFRDIRQQVAAHKSLLKGDVLAGEGFVAHVASLIGAQPTGQVEAIELVHRLASIFYSLGKAYICTGLDPEYREKLLGDQTVFEQPVPVSATKNKGRGFVDGVLQRDEDADPGAPLLDGRIDWRNARHMLNGQLEAIESPIEKGRRLLAEAIQADPSYEEPRLYLAFLDAREGKTLKAERGFRSVFDTGVDEANRAHAATQLGLLYETEEDYRRSILFNRWVLQAGIEARDARFSVVHFNIGLCYAHLGRQDQAVASFRRLLDRFEGRSEEAVALFRRSPMLQSAIDLQPGFPEALRAACPELFEDPEDEAA